MAGRLVTIATFDLPTKARLAQNVLERAGIAAVVTDEQIVTMDWLLGNAVGWVKVQVLEENADRAVTVLEEELGTEPVDEQTLAAQAEAATAEPEPESPPPHVPIASEPNPAQLPDEEGVPSEREEYARKLFFIAWFGLIFSPIIFIAFYFFLNAAFGKGPLNARGRFNLFVGGVTTILGMCLAYLFCYGLGGLFL